MLLESNQIRLNGFCTWFRNKGALLTELPAYMLQLKCFSIHGKQPLSMLP